MAIFTLFQADIGVLEWLNHSRILKFPKREVDVKFPLGLNISDQYLRGFVGNQHFMADMSE